MGLSESAQNNAPQWEQKALLFPVLYLGDFCANSHQEFPGTTSSLLWARVGTVTLPGTAHFVQLSSGRADISEFSLQSPAIKSISEHHSLREIHQLLLQRDGSPSPCHLLSSCHPGAPSRAWGAPAAAPWTTCPPRRTRAGSRC